MTQILATAVPAGRRDRSGQLTGAAVRYIAAALEAMRRAHRQRKAISALQALDDRMLKDIGIARADIVLVTRSASSRDADRVRHSDRKRFR